MTATGHDPLEFDDIQHILLTRAPALTGRYEFLSFPVAGRGGPGWRACSTRCIRPQAARATLDSERLGEHRLHLERAAGARTG